MRGRATVAWVGSWSVARVSGEGRPVGGWALGQVLVGIVRRDIVHDIAAAALAALVGGLGQSIVSSDVELSAYWGIVASCSAILLVRSRVPRTCLAVLAVLMLVHQIVLHQPSALAATICVIAAYTTQTRLAPPWRWSYLALIYIGAAGAILLSTQDRLGPIWPNRVAIAVAVWAIITIAALAGAIRSRNRTRMELALERAAFLESHYELAQRLATAEERTRIAREMHDILGHSLNAIAVQAEGARYVIRSDTNRAERALADIGRLSRTAVDEAHGLIQVLRAEDDHASQRSVDTSNGQSPTPTLHDLGTLVRSFQPSGSAIRLRLDGDLSSVPPQVSVAAYRVVQEALTNAIKHAGQVRVTIRVSVTSREVRLLVANGRPATSDEDRKHTEGHGITGMRERVRALGGRIDIGPDPTTSGWRVSASLPWRAT